MAADEGMRATVYQLAHDDDGPARRMPGSVDVRVIRIALRALPLRRASWWKLCRYAEFSIRAFFALVFQEARIIVAHDLSALLPAWCAARFAGKRVVYNAHELYGETNEVTAPMQALWRRLDRFLCPRVDAMIVPEIHRARIYREEYGARELPLVIPNVPMYRAPVASTLLRDFLRAQGCEVPRILLYQGLFDEGRCLHHIVSAMADAPDDVALVLMGRGYEEYTRRLMELRAALHLERRVFVHPAVPYDTLHAFSCSADAGILLYRNDSRNNYYCAPNKIYEYFQAGLPVIASDFPGLKALVVAGNAGVCVDPESPAAIAAAIRALFADSEGSARRERILTLAREKYHWEAEFGKLRDVYRNL
jgi:glycosyltransferase involved in cell wall biosynthesis